MKKIHLFRLMFLVAVLAYANCYSKTSKLQEELDNSINQGAGLMKNGQYKEALPYLQKALEISEKGFGTNDDFTAGIASLLAGDLAKLGDYKKALEIHKVALTGTQSTKGKDSDQCGLILMLMGQESNDLGELKNGETYYLEALNIFTKNHGEKDRNVASALNGLVTSYINSSNSEKAIECGEKARHIYESVLEPNNPSLIAAYSNLGKAYEAVGDYPKALEYHKKSQGIAETVLGLGHPSAAKAIQAQASCYESMGNFKEAFPLIEKSIKIYEGSLGKDNPDSAFAVCDLATFYFDLGETQRALSLYQDCLAKLEESLGKDHLGVGFILEKMALCYSQLLQKDKELEIRKRVLEIRQKGYGENDPHTASAWGGEGVAYLEIDDTNNALPCLIKYNAGMERALGSNNISTSDSLAALGLYYKKAANYPESEKYLDSALSINSNAFSINSPKVSDSIYNLAGVLALDNKTERAINLTKRWVDSVQAQLSSVFNFGEAQRLAWASQNLLFSLPANILPNDKNHELILRWKGIVLDSLIEDLNLESRFGSDQKSSKTLQEIQSLKYRIAKLANSSDQSDSTTIESLQQQIDHLQAKLSSGFQNRVRASSQVTIEQLENVLSPSDAIINIVSFKNLRTESGCYGVSIVSHASSPKWVSIEDAKNINESVAAYRKAIASGDEASLKSQIEILSEKLWKPIALSLPADTKRVFICADGPLNFLSFATLQDNQGKFLSESYQVAYVGSGRDLLRPFKPSDKKNILIYANPVFARDDVSNTSAASNNALSANKVMRPAELAEFAKVQLPQLPGTEQEAAIVSNIAKDAQWSGETHLGLDASKKNLMSIKAPSVLHLATHGFFLGGEDRGGEGERGMKISASAETPTLNGSQNTKPLKISPMRQSGVALAGGQSTLQAWGRGEFPDPTNDGILTAEEVSGLNLDGTWLVTLSACETGVGQVQSGEGVFGLRRAFMMAGTQNLLMTLWPVSDEVTPKIMSDFYKKALANGDAAGSLSDVQRDWLVKLKNEKGLLAAVRDAGPFAMVVMANSNVKPSSSDTKPEKAPVPTTSVNTESTDATVSEAGNSHGCKILEFQEALTKADGGDPYAEAIVSIYYGLGYKTDKDTAKAVEYASKSAKQENPLGIYVLGSLTAQGDGVEKDPDKGRDLKIKAIEGLNTMTNDPYALSSLGAMALRGEGLSKDLKKAALLYNQSADLGYAPAQFIYAIMLSKGAGVSRNDKKAAQYMQKAQSQNFNVK